MKLLKTAAALALFFTLFSLADPAISAEKSPPGTIKIGLTLALSGRYAEMGNMQLKGYRLWEQEVNKRGGILGRKVRLVIYDDGSSPKAATDLYKRLIINDRVDMLFGPYSSEIAEAVLPITEHSRYPLILPGAIADRLWEKGYHYAFGLMTPASKITVGFLELAAKSGLKDIAVAHADEPFSHEVAEHTTIWAERFGLRIVFLGKFKRDIDNFEELARKAKASGAQVLMVCSHFNAAVAMRTALKKIGWYPKAYYATVGPALQKYADRLSGDAEHSFSSVHWEYQRGPHHSECNAFCDAYVKTYKELPAYFSADAYAGGQILEAAIRKAGSIDKERIRDLLSTMDATSIIGRYNVDKTGKQIKHFNLIIQWQKGRKEIVWPEELQTARPVFR